jgi:selenocysteine-specific elongation factor
MPDSQTRRFIIGTAGHIDHGKSTLIEALTGTDPDRLPEEKARGITIDLGFAHLEITDPENPDRRYDLGVIDVPGHADFVKNMVAGVGSLNLALFVVAADDGWMPQSEEHLHILNYLGVEKAVIALTKADTVEDPAEVSEEIALALEGTPFEDAPIIPVCAIIGDGLDELRTAVCRALDSLAEPLDIGKPRLAVDRVFSPQGIGTVVTGTLTGGRLKKGQKVLVEPGAQASGIRNLQSHKSNTDEAFPGTRTAINLPDLTIASVRHRSGLRRGAVVTIPGLGESARRFHVLLEKTTRTVPGASKSSRVVRHAQRVRLHHGSASISARVLFFENADLNAGGRALAELRLDTPAFSFAGDRFVLRDWSNSLTLAGGVILDPNPAPRAYRSAGQKLLLETRAQADAGCPEYLASLLVRDLAVPRENLLCQSRFSDAEVAATLEAGIADGSIIPLGHWLMEAKWWRELISGAGQRVDTLHASNPELPGLPLSTLRAFVKKHLRDEKLFDLVLDGLSAKGYTRAGTLIRNSSHVPQLPPQLRDAGTRILAKLAENPLEPPNPGELATTADEKTALKFLTDSAQAVILGEKAIISASAYQEAIDRVRECLQAKGQATASELRDALETTRRILIPLLEKLDKDGITLRKGDFRFLKG